MKALVLAVGLMLGSAPAEAACRLALALGLDVSGSVNAAEYALQRTGLAAAPDTDAARTLRREPRRRRCEVQRIGSWARLTRRRARTVSV